MLKDRWVDRWHELAARLPLTEDEVVLWPKLADAIATGFDPRTLGKERGRIVVIKPDELELK